MAAPPQDQLDDFMARAPQADFGGPPAASSRGPPMSELDYLHALGDKKFGRRSANRTKRISEGLRRVLLSLIAPFAQLSNTVRYCVFSRLRLCLSAVKFTLNAAYRVRDIFTLHIASSVKPRITPCANCQHGAAYLFLL
eukprot:6211944-Pleurochrysis_carterae.AAC.2